MQIKIGLQYFIFSTHIVSTAFSWKYSADFYEILQGQSLVGVDVPLAICILIMYKVGEV